MLAPVAAMLSVGLLVPALPVVPAAQRAVLAQPVFAQPPPAPALFPGASTELLAAEEPSEEDLKNEARQKGLLVLAFGILPSVLASGQGIPGAFDKDKTKRK